METGTRKGIGIAVMALIALALVILRWPSVPDEVARHRLSSSQVRDLRLDESSDALLHLHLGSLVTVEGGWRSLAEPCRSLAAVLTFERMVRAQSLASYVQFQALMADVPTFAEAADSYRRLGAVGAAEVLERAAMQLATDQSVTAAAELDQEWLKAFPVAQRVRSAWVAEHADEVATGE
ncbi:MAG: hypothetical protein PF961_15505 [Planctomycetota bacterium]|jgi:hypothetical protein|nr:hypothetical protein [Planctomycetota bacterium]